MLYKLLGLFHPHSQKGIIQDEPLGLVEVPLGCVSSLFGEPQWLHLQGGHGAQIRLLAFFKQDEPEPPVPPLAALPSFSVEYEVHSAALAGIATTQFGQSYRFFHSTSSLLNIGQELQVLESCDAACFRSISRCKTSLE